MRWTHLTCRFWIGVRGRGSVGHICFLDICYLLHETAFSSAPHFAKARAKRTSLWEGLAERSANRSQWIFWRCNLAREVEWFGFVGFSQNRAPQNQFVYHHSSNSTGQFRVDLGQTLSSPKSPPASSIFKGELASWSVWMLVDDLMFQTSSTYLYYLCLKISCPKLGWFRNV